MVDNADDIDYTKFATYRGGKSYGKTTILTSAAQYRPVSAVLNT